MLFKKINGKYTEDIEYNVPGMSLMVHRQAVSFEHDSAFPAHWHSDIEFFLLTSASGEVSYTINDECIALKAGDGIFLNSKTLHFGSSVGVNSWEHIVLLFNPLLLCGNEYTERNFVNPVINNTNFLYQRLTQDIAWTAELFNAVSELQELFQKFGENAILEIQSRLFKIWSLLYSNMPPPAEDDGEHCDYNLITLKKMLKFMYTQYAEKITLADVSASGNVCRSRCCELFKKYLRTSPNNHLKNYRLQRAAELLEKTSLPITEIAVMTGFADASYFSDVFRKNYGCSPKEYRSNRVM